MTVAPLDPTAAALAALVAAGLVTDPAAAVVADTLDLHPVPAAG